MKRSALAVCSPLYVFGIVMVLGLAGCGQSDDGPVTKGGKAMLRRVTEAQYRQIVSDVFGATVTVPGRFEPDIRENGLLAVGTGKVTITEAGIEQYDHMARVIAAQVVDEKHRVTLIPCQPAKLTEPDDACAAQFLNKTGPLLFRRPLSPAELQDKIKTANEAGKKLGNFYSGIEASLAGLLVSPEFLFRSETTEPDPDHPGQRRLDPYSKASRLSFFLWDTAPDAELMASAQSGALSTKDGLAREVDRMLASPRLEAGVRAFFTDMFGFDAFNALAKDPTLYPKFNLEVAAEAQEQTLRTVVDLLVREKGDYRDIFTTRKTYLTRLLGSVYNVPVSAAPGWQSHEYAEGDVRAGVLSEISFVALHSHPGRSSATLRGKAVREIMFCQKVPDPPGNVNFSVVQNTDNPEFKTARERLTAHRTAPTCAGCHKMMDPIGLSMENFDTIGSYRTKENGAAIDASGELDGVPFKDAAGLGRVIHDNPQTPVCVANRMFAYGTGHAAARDEADWLKYLQGKFAKAGYRVPDLMRMLATSDAFYRISAVGTEANGAKPAELGYLSEKEIGK